MSKNALIIIGSPRKGRSTSNSFADSFTSHFQKSGGSVTVFHAREAVETPESRQELEKAVEWADGIGLFFPLYVDSIPSNLLSALYHVETVITRLQKKSVKVFAATQCGFPFTDNMKHAVNNCRLFTKAIRGVWLGALAYGGGVLINGAPLDSLGKKGAKLDKVFEGMAEAVLEDQPIPEQVLKPVCQKERPFLFRLMVPLLNLVFRLDEKKAGKDLRARPYENMDLEWD